MFDFFFGFESLLIEVIFFFFLAHLQHGSQFHSSIQNYFDNGDTPNPNSQIYETWKSVSPILDQISDKAELVEAPIAHPALMYKGIVDCVASVNDGGGGGGELCVLEWKKSDRPKSTLQATYDAPLQMCAYLGALNADSRYNLNLTNGAVVIAYTDGRKADFYRMDGAMVRQYWRAWLMRLQEYWIRCRDGTLPEPI